MPDEEFLNVPYENNAHAVAYSSPLYRSPIDLLNQYQSQWVPSIDSATATEPLFPHPNDIPNEHKWSSNEEGLIGHMRDYPLGHYNCKQTRTMTNGTYERIVPFVIYAQPNSLFLIHTRRFVAAWHKRIGFVINDHDKTPLEDKANQLIFQWLEYGPPDKDSRLSVCKISHKEIANIYQENSGDVGGAGILNLREFKRACTSFYSNRIEVAQ